MKKIILCAAIFGVFTGKGFSATELAAETQLDLSLVNGYTESNGGIIILTSGAANTGTGNTLSITNGEVSLNADAALDDGSATNYLTVTLGGGRLSSVSAARTTYVPITLTDATTSEISVSGGDFTFSSVISGSGNLEIYGSISGDVVFNATNTFTGTLALVDADLTIGAPGTIGAPSAISIASGRTLSFLSSGVISGDISVVA